MFCYKCGTQAEEGAGFCQKCGAKLVSEGGQQQQSSQLISQNDDKLMAILSYLGFLWLIPLCTGAYKNSEFVKFHFNQGAVIILIAIGWGIISSILRGIFIVSFFWFPVMSVLVNLVISVVSLGLVALVVICIINVTKDKMDPLPVIGDIKLFK